MGRESQFAASESSHWQTCQSTQPELNRHTRGRTLCLGETAMQFDAVRAAALAVVRSVDEVKGYVTIKRCRRCQHLLRKRAIVCVHCGKWQDKPIGERDTQSSLNGVSSVPGYKP